MKQVFYLGLDSRKNELDWEKKSFRRIIYITMNQPRFNLGDLVDVKINNRMVHGTIIPYANDRMIIHDYNLRSASEIDFRHVDDDGEWTRDPEDHYTADGQLHAMSDGDVDFYYIVLLPTGEMVRVLGDKLENYRSNDRINRKIRNINSNSGVRTLKGVQDDRRQRHVPYLPDPINDHIRSYLTETPLSNRINTRIRNRENPGIRSSAIPYTIAQFRADERRSVNNDRRERNALRLMDPGNESEYEEYSDVEDDATGNITGGTGKTSKMEKVRKMKKTRKNSKKRKTIKRRKRTNVK